MQWLPAAWEQHRLIFLKEMGELVNHIIHHVAVCPARIECEVGTLGFIEWIRNTSEIGYLPQSGLGVQSFHVSLFADLKGGRDMNHD